jgi:hypothetical protein
MKSRKHLQRVAELPCVVCGSQEVQAHHIRDKDVCGMGLKAADLFSFPICQPHHANLHSDIPLWEMRYGKQWAHVEATILRLMYG